MAYKINNPLLAKSPLNQRFNLQQTLDKEAAAKAKRAFDDQMNEFKNFKAKPLETRSFQEIIKDSAPKTFQQKFRAKNEAFNEKLNERMENFQTGINDFKEANRQSRINSATGTEASRLTEAQALAFEDYKDRLATSKQYGKMDQFGVYSGFDKEKPTRESQEGYTYLPIGNIFGGDSEGDNREYPVLSSRYGDNNGNLTSNRFVNPNSAEYGNLARREAALGNSAFTDNDATNSYMGGTYDVTSGVDYPQEFYDKNKFQNFGQRLMGSTDVGGFRFNPENNLSGFANQEKAALNARNASNYAVAEFEKALAAGDKAGAQAILDAANNQLQTSTRDGGFGYTAKRDDGMYGVGGVKDSAGDRRYVNSPGTLFGYRTKDNLQFRTDQASNLYDTDYMPTRNEEVDRAKYAAYLKASQKDPSDFFPETLDIKPFEYSFDTRSGM